MPQPTDDHVEVSGKRNELFERAARFQYYLIIDFGFFGRLREIADGLIQRFLGLPDAMLAQLASGFSRTDRNGTRAERVGIDERYRADSSSMPLCQVHRVIGGGLGVAFISQPNQNCFHHLSSPVPCQE